MKNLFIVKCVFYVGLFALSGPVRSAESPSAQALQILKDSDRARGGVKEGLEWKIQISTAEDEETHEREYLVKAKETDAYVEALTPARYKGEVYLFNDRNMWFFKPSLKKPVSISARQKLTGQAANGDIATTNYARDYTPELVGSGELQGEKVHVLLLKAKATNLTYDQIRYYVTQGGRLAIKAEFLTLQGEIFKVGQMVYGNTLKADGKDFPFISELMIQDARFPENKSTIRYSAPKQTQIRAGLFNVNSLSR